ncbi:MAG: FAD-dependent oxidoreductase, partial [Succinivibrio dextrinosolvens]|nr:FAD-dependent oxidoreductase [Succinivibrio dextrinosolvens]
NLSELGLSTTIVELSDHIMPNVDIEVATVAQHKLKEKGIEIILNDGVKAFSDDKVILDSGVQVPFDIVIMSIGVRPQIELVQKAGLEVSRGIIVDSTLRTSDKNIYAAGDNVEITDFATGTKALIPLAGPANRQGRIIADNICGKNENYKNTQGSSVVKIFNLTLAAVGATEARLKKLNIPYLKTFIYANSHAGYYPGATQILYKMLFTKEGRILGLQAIGEEGVEKRVDVVATIMRLNGTVHDLLDSELCYAPPFNSAKDAINILGMNALNIIEGKVKMAFPEDLEDSYLIDVRPKAVFMNETIDGAVNIPITEIRNRLDEIPRDRKVVMFCNTGYTSYVASRIVNQNGFDNVYSFGGGIVFFKALN